MHRPTVGPMGRGRATTRAEMANRTGRPVCGGASEPDHAALLRAHPAFAGADLTMVSLVGSRAYGLHHADSDYDYRGIYQASTRDMLGLTKPKEQLESKEPDVCCFEVGKFCALALAGNPNVLEVLWATPVIDTPEGAQLRELRGAFLSERVRTAYIGYAASQLKKALSGERAAQYERRRAKAIRHLFRLALQGEQLLRTGDLTLRLGDPEQVRSYEKMDDPALQATWAQMKERLDTLPSVLPEHPDRDRIGEVIYKMRLHKLRGDLDR